MQLGSMISILIGGAVAYNAVATRMIHGTVQSTTDKAVQLKLDNGQFLWLPKSALSESGSSYKLAPWFLKRMSDQEWRKIERNQSIGGVCA